MRRAAGPVDVAVIGGGVTGCACALALAEAGRRVRVYEAREIAGGASGRNGGFALRGAAPAYDAAREQLGAEAARALWRLSERYLGRLAELGGDAFRRTGSLRLAADATSEPS
jgi:gamma-glutamylputrescine oxidase